MLSAAFVIGALKIKSWPPIDKGGKPEKDI